MYLVLLDNVNTLFLTIVRVGCLKAVEGGLTRVFASYRL